MKIIGLYQPRFVSDEQLATLVNYYHLARTALAGDYANNNRHWRMLWACREFHKENPSISQTAAYKDLSATMEGY